MRRVSIILAFTISALFSIVALAQTPPPPQTTKASAGGAGAEGKIAIINTAAFRVGIEELKTNLEALNKEFESKNKELEGLRKQITDLKTKLESSTSTAQTSASAQLMEQGVELEKTLKRKSEDYQGLFQKRGQELVSPVMDKVNKFLGVYSQQHNIVLVLERQIAENSSLLVWAAPVMEITDDFIKEYNKANPSAAPRK